MAPQTNQPLLMNARAKLVTFDLIGLLLDSQSISITLEGNSISAFNDLDETTGAECQQEISLLTHLVELQQPEEILPDLEGISISAFNDLDETTGAECQQESSLLTHLVELQPEVILPDGVLHMGDVLHIGDLMHSKLEPVGPKARLEMLADEQAEMDFQNLCRSFSEDEEDKEIYSRQPLATRAIQPTTKFTASSTAVAISSSLAQPIAQSASPAQSPLSFSIVGHRLFASLDVDDGDYGEQQLPVSTLLAHEDEESSNAPHEESMILLAGRDDAWWKAEYARRDAAFPKEERARKACKRYYQRNHEQCCERAKKNYQKKKIQLVEGTDKEREAAHAKKQESRAQYRQENRAVLAEKARLHRARQRQCTDVLDKWNFVSAQVTLSGIQESPWELLRLGFPFARAQYACALTWSSLMSLCAEIPSFLGASGSAKAGRLYWVGICAVNQKGHSDWSLSPLLSRRRSDTSTPKCLPETLALCFGPSTGTSVGAIATSVPSEAGTISSSESGKSKEAGLEGAMGELGGRGLMCFLGGLPPVVPQTILWIMRSWGNNQDTTSEPLPGLMSLPYTLGLLPNAAESCVHGAITSEPLPGLMSIQNTSAEPEFRCMSANQQLVLNTDGIHPRVNASLLRRFINCFVTLPAQVMQVDTNTGKMLVKTSDNVCIHIDLQRLPEKLNPTLFVEVLGQVYCSADGTVSLLAIRVTNLGNDLGKCALTSRILNVTETA
ncbi:hypothetical protein BT96DRAFT_937624 [Gymnopus androsaceus JB14]|uniref:Uncharacterized protein n=1 Tax=Gymnopus androsaceus JB14 TaxID=1447944 RepID=A0A6A4HVE6_9AGAR|nr:hypothetical protein BT96DRAFT_937624 [Gymnopus androsaceus JB14]